MKSIFLVVVCYASMASASESRATPPGAEKDASDQGQRIVTSQEIQPSANPAVAVPLRVIFFPFHALKSGMEAGLIKVEKERMRERLQMWTEYLRGRGITAILGGRRPIVYGDGRQSRDFTYVGNVVEANLLAARRDGISGETFNVGCGASYTLNDLVARLNKILGTRLKPEYGPPRPGDVKHSMASIDKAGRLLGYKPVVVFEDGLRRTVEWFSARCSSVS